MTTAVVFGGSGYLGRHVVAALDRDPRVDRVLAPGRRDCDVLSASAAEVNILLRALRPDVVVNCTGRLDGTPQELVDANTGVTAKLLTALETLPARLVRIGSAGEYGPVVPGVAVDEDRPARPVGPYGASHLEATRLVEEAGRKGRVDGVTLRVFNPIGSGLGANTVLGRAAQQLRDAVGGGTRVIRLGPLGAHRDFVDARDVASAVVAAGFARTPLPTLNVGSGRATQVRDAVEMLAEIAGFDGEIHEEPVEPGRSGGVDWIQADIARAREALGWLPRHHLRESLSEIWRDVAPADLRAPVGALLVNRRPAELTSFSIGGEPR